MVKNKKKKVLIGSGIVLILLIASLIGGSLYMLDFSLRPVNRGKDMEGSMAYMRQTYPHIVPWIDSLNQCRALRDTFITAPDGIRMHAFYVRAPRPTAHTAVIVHGYTDNAIRMFHIGYLYNRSLGYNILLPDLRYTGLTEGDAIQMGWLDRKDVIQWINTAPHIFGDSIRAVVHGISMGAATTMMVSGEKLPDYIRCLVFCGRLRIYQCMGPVQERTERSVPPARLSFIICDRMDMPASERLELPRGFGSESGKEMPQTHAFHSWR